MNDLLFAEMPRADFDALSHFLRCFRDQQRACADRRSRREREQTGLAPTGRRQRAIDPDGWAGLALLWACEEERTMFHSQTFWDDLRRVMRRHRDRTIGDPAWRTRRQSP